MQVKKVVRGFVSSSLFRVYLDFYVFFLVYFEIFTVLFSEPSVKNQQNDNTAVPITGFGETCPG